MKDGSLVQLKRRWLVSVSCLQTKENQFHIFCLFTFIEYEPDELNPSLYSFHSDVDEKNKLLYSFSQQGIETVVDRVAKKNRIKDWIQSSIIIEEEEYEVCIHRSKNLYSQSFG